MDTVTQAWKNDEVFSGEQAKVFNNQIVLDAETVITVDTKPEKQAKIVQQLAAFCSRANKLGIDPQPNGPVRLFATIGAEELIRGCGETILTVEILPPKGSKKKGMVRVNLRLEADHEGNIRASVHSPKRQTDVVKTIKGNYVDWDKPIE